MNYKDWETPRNTAKSVASVLVVPQFSSMPVNRTVILGNSDDLKSALQWAKDMYYKIQTQNPVVYQGKVREAVIFKKQKDAALFKIVWG
jgi:hypothetical protein